MIACTLAPRGGSAVLINLRGCAARGSRSNGGVEGRLVSRVLVYHDHVVGTSAMNAVVLLGAKPTPQNQDLRSFTQLARRCLERGPQTGEAVGFGVTRFDRCSQPIVRNSRAHGFLPTLVTRLLLGGHPHLSIPASGVIRPADHGELEARRLEHFAA